MSTVKIKTEPTAAVAVDVQVKLESSLSTGDIKLEQHSSDVDTKVESDSEDDIKSESDSEDGDTDQNDATAAPKKQRHWICEYSGCGRSFSLADGLKRHQHEHRLQAELYIIGKTYTLTRRSLDVRWPCPIPDCTSTAITTNAVCDHIRAYHGETMKKQQHHSSQMTQHKRYFVDVDNFYMNGVRCGYHNAIRVFICHDCKLVPECLLIHLQQKHGFDEKSIDSTVLPESAVTANADPSNNQHTSNLHLASAISQPYQQHHQNIVQGWLCVTSDCGYCGCTSYNKCGHRKRIHQGEQISTVPALILRLVYSKTQASGFLITRLGQASGAVTASNSRVSQHIFNNNHSGLNTQDENDDDVDQNETKEASNQKRQWKCEYHNCGRSFSSSDQLSKHRREHKLEVMTIIRGAPFTLSRQSLDDRWTCPISDCEMTYKTIDSTHCHIINAHNASMKHKCSNSEDNSDQQQKRQQKIKKRQLSIHYLKVDSFYVCGTRCGYHTTTGLFICHECKLVPECLLTHLQQKHEFDEKSIDTGVLPESAGITGSDPNDNQHTSNLHLASAISQPFQQQHHQDIVQGWLCVISDCGYCSYTKEARNNHQYKEHKDEHLLTAPVLVLRLPYGKAQSSCFLITQLDSINSSIKSTNSTSQHNSECDIDDGDDLVLSDYGDEDDIN